MNIKEKKILYISNIEVPYRNEFFNLLSKNIDLTVLYERKKSSNRNSTWTKSIKPKYDIKYLNGIKIKKEFCFDFRILKYIFSKKYTDIIVGCYNSPSQLFAILVMIILKKRFILNIDGEYFIQKNGFKNKCKLFILSKAESLLVAGNHAATNLKSLLSNKNIVVYNFSSLLKKEIKTNMNLKNNNKNDCILVVGQFIPEKGLDLALKCAKLNGNIKYKFIGSGNRSDLLQETVNNMNLKNVEIIPFLQKKDLYYEYQQCKCMLLPSRRECWGLVVNEAASFGCPIISTTGSGAAMELLEKKWVIDSGDYNAMYNKILELNENNYDKSGLIKRASNYSIEQSVDDTLSLFEVK